MEEQYVDRLISRLLTMIERQKRVFMGKALEGSGLRGPLYRYLLLLDTNPGATQEFLAERLSIEKGNNARLAKELEDLGLINRSQDSSDRRQYKIYLTDKGKDLLPAIKKALGEWRQALNKGLSLDEQEMVAGLLQRMLENATAQE
jgi:DNA-binding MarR family transcriptional regulator